jgi:hypothetical protein
MQSYDDPMQSYDDPMQRLNNPMQNRDNTMQSYNDIQPGSITTLPSSQWTLASNDVNPQYYSYDGTNMAVNNQSQFRHGLENPQAPEDYNPGNSAISDNSAYSMSPLNIADNQQQFFTSQGWTDYTAGPPASVTSSYLLNNQPPHRSHQQSSGYQGPIHQPDNWVQTNFIQAQQTQENLLPAMAAGEPGRSWDFVGFQGVSSSVQSSAHHGSNAWTHSLIPNDLSLSGMDWWSDPSYVTTMNQAISSGDRGGNNRQESRLGHQTGAQTKGRSNRTGFIVDGKTLSCSAEVGVCPAHDKGKYREFHIKELALARWILDHAIEADLFQKMLYSLKSEHISGTKCTFSIAVPGSNGEDRADLFRYVETFRAYNEQIHGSGSCKPCIDLRPTGYRGVRCKGGNLVDQLERTFTQAYKILEYYLAPPLNEVGDGKWAALCFSMTEVQNETFY